MRIPLQKGGKSRLFSGYLTDSAPLREFLWVEADKPLTVFARTRESICRFPVFFICPLHFPADLSTMEATYGKEPDPFETAISRHGRRGSLPRRLLSLRNLRQGPDARRQKHPPPLRYDGQRHHFNRFSARYLRPVPRVGTGSRFCHRFDDHPFPRRPFRRERAEYASKRDVLPSRPGCAAAPPVRR